jgi:hypothetical protein
VSASVILVDEGLQFVGVSGTECVRFVVRSDALKRLSGFAKPLTRQETFRTFDRHREWLQEIGRRLYEQSPTHPKTIKITLADVLL